MRHVQKAEEASHRTIKRRSDEPRLQIGDTVPLSEGMVGIVLARFVPSGRTNEVRYVVEVVPTKAKGEHP